MTLIDSWSTGDGDRQGGKRRRRMRFAFAATAAAAIALVSTNPQVIFRNDTYADNLAMIHAQPGRNTTMDASAARGLDQDELDIATGGLHIGLDRNAYLGNPNGNPEQAFPVTSGGQFRTACEFSHFSYDDPLIFPGQPGRAHLHMFYGNTEVNAYSTYETLSNSGSSTCNGGEVNRTGYWAPAMIDPDPAAPGGAWVRIPERVVVYYKGEGLANGANYTQFPNAGSKPYQPGMAMIANRSTVGGDGVSVPELADFDGGSTGEKNFKCSNNFSAFPVATGIDQIPNCDGDYWFNTFGAPYPATRTILEVDIKFWNCFPTAGDVRDWLEWSPSGATRGQWFYSNCNGEGGQGAGSPPLGDKDIYPNLSTFVNYVVMPGEDTSDWYLASDVDGSTHTITGTRGASLHSDWWGAWHPDINQEFLDNCVNFNSGSASGCGFGYLSDGGTNGGNPNPGRALTYRPQYDVVGDANSYRIGIADLFTALCTPLNPGRALTTPESGANCITS